MHVIRLLHSILVLSSCFAILIHTQQNTTEIQILITTNNKTIVYTSLFEEVIKPYSTIANLGYSSTKYVII